MEQTYQSKATSFQNRSHRRRNWRRVFLGMAMVVVFVTTYMLILPAITMENDLVCGLEEHTHGDACYTTRLVCALEDEAASAHVHGEGCYAREESLTCGLEEGAHTHGAGCYTRTQTLTCGDPAHAGHSHGGGCYEEQEILLCSLEETEGHRHDEELCYGQVQDLICELAEVPAHSHGTDCWGVEQVLVCELPLCEDSHIGDCYAETEELTCGLTEEDVHTHDESCVTVEEILVCDDTGDTVREVSVGETGAALEAGSGAEAVEEHFHGETCYQKELICQIPEHIHDDTCKGSPDEEAPLPVLPQGVEIPMEYDKEYTFTDEQGRFQAAVYAPAGALPRGAQLQVSLLAQDSPDFISAAQALTEEYAGLLALDIRFELDGAEVEPAGPIYVCINAPGLLPRDADPDSVTVEHHLETGSAAVEVVAGAENGVETTEEGGLTAAFGVDRLSVFTVRWSSLNVPDQFQTQTGVDTLAQGMVFHFFDYDPQLVNSGEAPVLLDVLGEDGYPVLAGEEGQSLASLFDPQGQTEGKTVYPNANFLLQEGEDGYFFDSSVTFAQMALVPQDYTLANGETVRSYPFTLYDQTDGAAFLPFNSPGQEENLAFGMTMTVQVTMPGEDVPMALELGGSDDLWLFVDGKLILDLSGSNAAGLVNFSAGASVTTGDGSLTLEPGQVWTEQDGVRELWPLLGLEEPWAADSTHSLSLFYLNRGESRPTFRMNLNLSGDGEEPAIFLPDFMIHIPLSLKLQGAEQVVGTSEAWPFHFFLTQVSGPDGAEPGESTSGTMTTLAIGSLGNQSGAFTLTFPGDAPEGTYHYKIYQEYSDPREGVDYDSSFYIAEVEVTGGTAEVTSLTHYVDGEGQPAQAVTFTNVAAAEGTLTLNNVVERADGTPQKPIACNEYALTFSTSVLDKDYRTYYAPYTNENLTEGGLIHDGGDGRLAFNVDRVKGTATAHVELHPGESVTITLPAGAEVEITNLWTMAFDVKWTGDTATGNEVAGNTVTAATIGGDVEVTCINTTGFQLPETGGMGTTPLLVLGMLLTFGAGGLLLLMRRKGGAVSP